ncbi:MAG: aminoglycoside phosphotransferase [Leifsonia xyli]|nr:MAG: aminoglycoside phosphotransferase [Leifsonia xyli]
MVRVGDTVRKPWEASTPSVHAFMAAVRAAGAPVPAVLPRDAQGRQVLEFVPGVLAKDAPPLDLDGLRRVGGIVRAIHDASAGFEPAPDARWSRAIPSPADELVCHNDLAPWNLVLGERWVFIDWDAAAPSTRLWDLAYAAQAFALNEVERHAADAAARLAAFVDGYGADAGLRSALPEALAARASAMLELLESGHRDGVEPWGSMYRDGHGAHWRAVTAYVREHREVWAAAVRGSEPGLRARGGSASRAESR